MGSVDAAERWGESGLAYLTGRPTGPPDFSRAAVLVEASRVSEEIRHRCRVEVNAAEILAGRAALLGLSRGGVVSAGGATRLLSARDGFCAVTLSRPDDIEALAALLEIDGQPSGPWAALGAWSRGHDADEIIGRARLLGIPAAVLGESCPAEPSIGDIGPRVPPRPLAGLLVADLSSMWAGPLVGQILARAGATVVKVETTSRPDGTRAGDADFFDWMNGLKLSYAVGDIGEVRSLLAVADVVLQASRPSALAHRGVGPDDVERRSGRVWLRITGHGATGEQANWVAFGDDAAVAGGLVGSDTAGPFFCADAIADPLTGLSAALAVLESLNRGGGETIDVSMAAVAATYAALPLVPDRGQLAAPPPKPPPPSVAAPRIGADNPRVSQLIYERSCTPC